MATAFQRLVAFSLVVLVSGFLVSSCSTARSAESGAAGTSGEGTAFVGLMISSIFMTVENRAGGPLLNIRLAIKPFGGSTEFTKLLTRLEAGEKRNISLGEFGGRDGTPFSLRVVRPKEVSVTAVDLMDKKYAMTIPWTQ
jgi:hypothetical protein